MARRRDEGMVELVSCAHHNLYPEIIHVLTCEVESDVLSPRLVRSEDHLHKELAT